MIPKMKKVQMIKKTSPTNDKRQQSKEKWLSSVRPSRDSKMPKTNKQKWIKTKMEPNRREPKTPLGFIVIQAVSTHSTLGQISFWLHFISSICFQQKAFKIVCVYRRRIHFTDEREKNQQVAEPILEVRGEDTSGKRGRKDKGTLRINNYFPGRERDD